MVFVIKMPNDPESNWAIIELQGDLKSDSETSFNNKFIGDLHFTKTGTPLLIIGHHILYGNESTMEKPLAVMEKVKLMDDESIEYVIKKIITKKIIFKTRPKPIVSL
ncbi:chromosome transmission fidelity protein 8 homolog [Onthophagus taurus]|uniref:chromosome transmission fidelity protein 8 homolog n=1 Tax=Onthophagus taurus TaxID=166361 RepID=UPI0039BE5847